MILESSLTFLLYEESPFVLLCHDDVTIYSGHVLPLACENNMWAWPHRVLSKYGVGGVGSGEGRGNEAAACGRRLSVEAVYMRSCPVTGDKSRDSQRLSCVFADPDNSSCAIHPGREGDP